MQTMPADHKDYLLLCSMASYREQRFLSELKGTKLEQHQHNEASILKNDWHPLATSEELGISGEGYFAVAYYKLWKGEDSNIFAEMAIAHRGTCFNEKGNVFADIQIAQQTSPKILEIAKQYIAQLFNASDFFSPEAVEKKFTITTDKILVKRVTHVGFSLGGFIAGACAYLSYLDYVRAFTFDAPGVAYLEFDSKDAKNRQVINYVTVPNLVNTCNKHYGEIRQILGFDQPSKLDVTFKIADFNNLGFASEFNTKSKLKFTKDMVDSSEQISLALSELFETLQSHNLAKLIDKSRSSDAKYRPVFHWPIAQNNFSYGKRPSGEIGLFPFVTGNNWIDIPLQLTAMSVQVVKGVWTLDLWLTTKRNNSKTGAAEGRIGIEHQRCNTIYYSDDHTNNLS